MGRGSHLWLAWLWCVVWPCVSAPAAETVTGPVAPGGEQVEVPAEVADPAFLFEVVRHVYRWYIDETDMDRLAGAQEFPFWVRLLALPLDPGDRSRFAEIVMPLLGTAVTLKKTDYRIDELNLEIKGRGYKITNVSKVGIPAAPGAADRVVTVDYAEMKAYLFRTRGEAAFPEGALFERLREALRQELKLGPGKGGEGRRIGYLAPLSPVANEVWVFWENRKLLIRFASDVDLTHPEVWAQETLMVRTWEALTQVVVSLDEAAGSNAFLTRDQIGRALFNCVVLGKRLEIADEP